MFSNKTRQDSIQKMQQEELDLLIIGGGITVPVWQSSQQHQESKQD